MVIIESKDDLKLFETENEKQDSFVIPILSDIKKHPLDNELCLIYIQMMDGQEFIASYNHSESLNNHKVNLVSKTTKYTYDKKLLNHVCSVGKVIDVNLLHYMRTNNPLDIERIDTNAHNFLNMRYYKKNNINTIIPMLKHLEYCRKLCKLLRFELETGGDSDDKMTYNNEVLDNLSYIESTGLQTTEDMVYSEYNLYTSTGRPSNRFGGLNFAALNKKDGSREKFISRYKNGVLVEMDYDGYHLRLIADRIGYEFPKGSVHEHMAKLYGTDYSEAKSLSFQYLYGYIPKEIQENNEYFSRVHEYIQKLWIEYKSKDFIVSDIYNKRIYKKNLTDMKIKAYPDSEGNLNAVFSLGAGIFADGIYTLKVELNSSLPQTIQSYRTAITNQPINIGLQSSRVISVIPTGSVSATYGDSTYDNEYVKCPNIFRGMTNIQLKKQDNSLATHLDKTNPYFMVISVGFNIDPELFNNAGM